MVRCLLLVARALEQTARSEGGRLRWIERLAHYTFGAIGHVSLEADIGAKKWTL